MSHYIWSKLTGGKEGGGGGEDSFNSQRKLLEEVLQSQVGSTEEAKWCFQGLSAGLKWGVKALQK